MQYKKGDRVKHPKLSEWGLGEVLADSSIDAVKIFFIGVGEKNLALKHVQPIKVEGKESESLGLDNLKLSTSKTIYKYQSLPQSIKFFLRDFLEGFYGEKFFNAEREYKEKAHTLALELLGKEPFAVLITQANYVEIAKRALKIVNSTNLISPFEKMALKDGLITELSQKSFSIALYVLLYGEDELRHRFEVFIHLLEEIEAAKWTTATYFLFILQPDKYMFVKPTVTQFAAEICKFEINYKPQLNWFTYKSVLEFSNHLYTELAELKPRDMIDVQSFMWCIAPEKYE